MAPHPLQAAMIPASTVLTLGGANLWIWGCFCQKWGVDKLCVGTPGGYVYGTPDGSS